MRENYLVRGPLPVQRLRDVAAILALGALRYCRLARKAGVPDGSFAWSDGAEPVANSTDFAESGGEFSGESGVESAAELAESIVGNSDGFSPN